MLSKIEELRANAEAAVAAYRAASEDPVLLSLDANHHIEISAPGPDACGSIGVSLGRENCGYIRARYTPTEAVAEIYDEDESNLLPTSSVQELITDLEVSV